VSGIVTIFIFDG